AYGIDSAIAAGRQGTQERVQPASKLKFDALAVATPPWGICRRPLACKTGATSVRLENERPRYNSQNATWFLGLSMTTENQIEQDLLAKLADLKYTYRPDIRDRAALETNFRDKFQQLNRVNLTDEEFARLLEEI